MGKHTSMFAVSPLYEIKQIFTIVMTVTTIILAAVAYAELAEISGDVIDIINNWKLVPFTEVYVANVGVDCAADFEEVSYKYGRFEGLNRGHCGCATNSFGYVSTFPNCSDVATASGACMTSNSRGGFGASTWRHQKVCFKRSGQPAASWENGYERRPNVDANGLCPKDYKKCGVGMDYNNDMAICYPANELCPITGVTVEPYAATPTGSDWEKANGTFAREGHHLWFRREGLGELPLAQLALTLTEYSSSNVGPDYNHIYNSRGPCYTGGAQDIKSAVEVSDTELAAHSISKPSRCDRVDRRYRLFDKARLDAFYLDQFEDMSVCSGYDLYPVDDSRFVASADADYLKSDVPCVGTACDRATTFPTNCLSSDLICDLVVNQNICGQYVSAVRDLKDDANSMGVYYRSEIKWRPDCDVDQDRLRDNVDPLKSALDAQLAVVVVSCIIGFFVGIVWPLCMLICLKKKHYGKPLEITIPERIDSVLHLAKMIPLIVSVVILGDIFHLYEMAGKDKCSDSLTNESFDYLAEKLPHIYYNNLANIIIEVIMMIAGGYFLYKKLKAQMKVDIEASADNEDDNGNSASSGVVKVPTVASIAPQPVTGAGIQMQPTFQQPQHQQMQQPMQPLYQQPQQQQQWQQPQMQQQQWQQPQMQQQQWQQPQMQQQQYQQPMQQQYQQPMQQQYQQQPTTMPTIATVGVIPTIGIASSN